MGKRNNSKGKNKSGNINNTESNTNMAAKTKQGDSQNNLKEENQVEPQINSKEAMSDMIKESIHDAYFEIQSEEEKKQNDKTPFTKVKEIGKKELIECIKKLVFVTFITGLLTFSYNALTKHAFEVDDISVSFTADKNVLSLDNNGRGMYYEFDDNCNLKDTVSLAPELEINVTNKGNFNSAYIYYRSEAYDDFIIQKLQVSDDRFVDAVSSNESCKVTLNYMLSSEKSGNFIYIIFLDRNNTPTIYVTYIDSDLKNMNQNLEIKTMDEIYELVPDREMNIWSLSKIYIIREVSYIVKNLP